VSDLAAEVELALPTVSNQLERLLEGGVVTRRRQGKRVLYRVVDGRPAALLDLGLQLLDRTAPTT
jgi:DNA-binding transcriptional ArsR family regulator